MYFYFSEAGISRVTKRKKFCTLPFSPTTSWCSAHSCRPRSPGHPFAFKCTGTPDFRFPAYTVLVLHCPHSCHPVSRTWGSLWFQATKPVTSLDIPQPCRHMSNTDPLLLLQFLTHNTRVPKPRTWPFLHSSLLPLWHPLNPGPNCPSTSHTCLCLISGRHYFSWGLSSPPQDSKLLWEGSHRFIINS